MDGRRDLPDGSTHAGSINHAMLLGQGTLQESVIGDVDRRSPPTMKAVLRSVEKA
jgi:hypothetical protein